MPRRLLILGSTGSIGTQALEIVEASGELELVGLSAERSWETLVGQASAHGVRRIALADADAGARAAEAWTGGEVLVGARGARGLVVSLGRRPRPQRARRVAGLGPTVATLGEGIDLALANKESLVVGGELVTALAEATGATLIPVDSEHTALHQLMPACRSGRVERLVITASGGPFRGRTRAELAGVTVERSARAPDVGDGRQDHDRLRDADEQGPRGHGGPPPLRHAVRRTSTSSCTRSRSSTGWSSLVDGASLAHMGHPDMRIPISYALHHPDPSDAGLAPLRLEEVGELTFEPVDTDAFPCLRLALEAAVAGGTAPCVLNAANEIAVHAFLGGPPAVPGHRRRSSSARWRRCRSEPVRAFESLYEADRAARAAAADLVGAERRRMSWVLAFCGFAALIILHEFGHFIRGEGGRDARRALLAVLPAACSRRSGAARPSTGSARSRSAAT